MILAVFLGTFLYQARMIYLEKNGYVHMQRRSDDPHRRTGRGRWRRHPCPAPRPGDDATASAVLDFAEGYVQLADGKVPYKQRDPVLHQGMVAVLPPLIETPVSLQSPQSH